MARHVSLLLAFVLLHTATPSPIPRHLRPSFPTIPQRPDLNLSETSTHITAILTHPSLNQTSTARITLATNPLTVNIDPLSGRPLSRRIPLDNTFSKLSLRARPGAVQLTLRKTAPDLLGAVNACKPPDRANCLRTLAIRVCQPAHRGFALTRLPCGDVCARNVLEDCQKADVFGEVASVATQVVFGVVAGVMLMSFGWGFASAIVSIPRELVGCVSCARELVQRTRVEGVKLELREALIKLVL